MPRRCGRSSRLHPAVETMLNQITLTDRPGLHGDRPNILYLLRLAHAPAGAGPDCPQEIRLSSPTSRTGCPCSCSRPTSPRTRSAGRSRRRARFPHRAHDVAEVLLASATCCRRATCGWSCQRPRRLLHERVMQRTLPARGAKLECSTAWRWRPSTRRRDRSHAARIGRTRSCSRSSSGSAKAEGDVDRSRRPAARHRKDRHRRRRSCSSPASTPPRRSRPWSCIRRSARASSRGATTDSDDGGADRISHREHWDGPGYPSGLPQQGDSATRRVVSVADVFDALTHRRPYKEPWPVGVAVREILGEAGANFDPRVTEASSGLDHAHARPERRHGRRMLSPGGGRPCGPPSTPAQKDATRPLDLLFFYARNFRDAASPTLRSAAATVTAQTLGAASSASRRGARAAPTAISCSQAT